MRIRRFVDAATGWRSLIIASMLITNIAAKKDTPSIVSSDFDNQPMNIEYFDDSDVILFQDWEENAVYRSENAGETWAKVEDIPYYEAWSMYMHPFDKKRAYVLTKETTHYMTADRGKTWQKFFTDSSPSAWRLQPMNFHAGDPDKIIFNGQDCLGIYCEEVAMYTKDGFSTDAKLLRGDTAGCYWAKSTPLFTTGNTDLDADRILCITKGEYSPFLDDYRLLISDYYFNANGEDAGEFEPNLEPGRTVSGVANMAIVKRYLVAAVTSKNTDEMALYVTDDTLKWHRAEFPHDHKLREEAYTILESTNYSIQLDVLSGSKPRNPMGVLLSSNSNGTYFTRNIEHTNREPSGYVDFEKMAGVQGIIFVNTVDNWEEVQDSILKEKNVISSISVDDGRNWQDLKTKDGEQIHLHSVTDISNLGRVLSSPAPGLVMGIGNTGAYLEDYSNGDLYVSDDAGLTWERALKGPHKYEFGDQGSILVAIAEGPTSVINYSLDHGKTWTAVDLPVENFVAQILTTTLDSTSLKFLLEGGRTNSDGTVTYSVMSIDFDDMHERTCTSDDMEQWWARVDANGNPTCLMGQKQYYMRRKKDADCFIKQEFKDPEVQLDPCPCTDADFECDFNFVRTKDRKKCDMKGSLIVPDGQCKAFDEDTTFLGSSGWRKIPGNNCTRGSGDQIDDPVYRKCSEAFGSPADGNVTHVQKPFTGKYFSEKIYLERTESSTGEDESIVARTDEGSIFLSKDHGKSWKEIEELKKAKVHYIIAHPYFNDVIYFVCDNMDVYYSVDRGNNVRKFGSAAPSYPDSDYWPIMNFHPKHKDWIIWVGVEDKSCIGNSKGVSDCHAEAYLTEDRGDSWRTLKRYVRKCEFVPEVAGQKRADKLIYCDAKKRESASDDNNPWQLVSSENFFEDWQTQIDDIIDFATMSEFIVVATKDEDTNMKAEASIDGKHFAEALFPANFKVSHQSGYTVMDSSTHSVFLLVTTEPNRDYKYGTLIKSNSNGTSYVLSLSAVNQDAYGYVDFEKVLGIEGVALANIVANPDTAIEDKVKRLKTKVTHNDGADWAFLPPPEKDVDGKPFECDTTAIDKCSLHIHGYTERAVKSHTYSSPSAVGLMLGIGNVGEYLTSRTEADTFISRDAGITWKQAKKGAYMWEFGDQGSIIILVRAKEETNVVYYSRDEGDTWDEYEFTNEPLVIDEITTVPSDNSRNFVLWATGPDGLATINLDFTGLTDTLCKLDESNIDDGDYRLWTPQHPLQDDDCLFGHVTEYRRKKTEADCYNGRVIRRIHNIARNCTCTRRDFECDYNFFRESEGTCSPVPNSIPLSHINECAANPDQIEYYDVSGYRRIPLTTCVGGLEMDKTGDTYPCPNKEDEYYRKHGIGGAGLFFAIVIPIAVASSAGWWVWKNWEGKFGQIRLGESSTFDEQAPYIKYPVLAISAIVAVIITLPTLASSGWRAVSGLFSRGRTARFTTRSSFARGANYTPVDEDEGELLGEDSDEEV